MQTYTGKHTHAAHMNNTVPMGEPKLAALRTSSRRNPSSLRTTVFGKRVRLVWLIFRCSSFSCFS